MLEEEEDDEEEIIKYEYVNLDIGFYNEIIGYESLVDYKFLFSNINEQTTIDLEREVEFYYNYFMDNPNISSINIDVNNKKVCNLMFDVEMYMYAISPKLSRIGMQIFLKDNASPLQHLSYIAHYNTNNCHSCPKQKSIFKKYIYNVLFMAHVFCHDFKYHPMLVYMYHKDDIDLLSEIKLRRSRLFGVDSECSVCMEDTIMTTNCNHFLCHSCYSKLKNKICPLCRSVLESQFFVLDPPPMQ